MPPDQHQPRLLTHAEAKAFYDRFGARQDKQGFYEDAAIELLIGRGRFAEANSILEFGCGTGRLAERLLGEVLAPQCRYLGLDISETMIELASARLKRWSDRARVRLSDGSMELGEAHGSFDRLVSCYVFDLLSEQDIGQLLTVAHRLLAPEGLLCTAGLTLGRGGMPALVSWAWQRIHAFNPKLVGGCRPIRVAELLSAELWRIEFREVVAAFAIASEVVIARRLAPAESQAA